MTLKSFLSTYKFQLNRTLRFYWLIPLICICGIIFDALITLLIAPEEFNINNIGISGIDSLCTFVMFILFADLCTEFFNTSITNGVSRKTTVIAAVCTIFTNALMHTAIISVLTPLLGLFPGSAEIWSASLMYSIPTAEIDIGFRARMFIIVLFSSFLFGMIAFMIATFFYRLSHTATIVVIVALSVLVCFLPSIIMVSLTNMGINVGEFVMNGVMKFFRFFGMCPSGMTDELQVSIPRAIAAMLLCAAVSFGISMLLTIKSNVKPYPVRNN